MHEIVANIMRLPRPSAAPEGLAACFHSRFNNAALNCSPSVQIDCALPADIAVEDHTASGFGIETA